MKCKLYFSAALIPLLVVLTAQTNAQDASLPLEPGMAAVTCFAGIFRAEVTILPDDYVVGVLDLRSPPQNLLGENWTPPMYHNPKWTARYLGQVYGLALDEEANIYVGATSLYGSPQIDPGIGLWGPGGPGAIYKLDRLTGDATTFAVLPNNGAGLGNIAYSRALQQFYVTNLEDGKIYRVDRNGNVLSNFDPFTPDNGRPGIVDRGEWIFGIGVKDGRVYYARWNEDWRNIFFPERNELWSIAVNAAGEFLPATNRMEFSIPRYPQVKWNSRSSGVADIAFAPDGRMILAELTLFLDLGMTEYFGRLLEYRWDGNAWSAPKTIYVGTPEFGTNAQGGVDYGYDNSLPPSQGGCYGSIWATGNPLYVNNVTNAGVAGIPAEGNTRATAGSTSFFIDADGKLITEGHAKSLMGDIEVFKECCSDGFVSDTLRASIGDYGPFLYDDIVEIGVHLDAPAKDIDIEELTLTVYYEPLAMRPIGFTKDSIYVSLLNTLLEDWTVTGVGDNGAGTIQLKVKPPAGISSLSDTGTLLWIQFQTFLIIDPATVTDSIGKIPLPFSLTVRGSDCSLVELRNGRLQLEACGLAYRLIESSFSKYSLSSVANPVREFGEVTFALGLDGYTELDIYDALGNRVHTLVRDYLDPGEYTLRWDASELPSGLYFYRLHSGDWSETAQIVIAQ